jgi:hypothetical protein
MFDWFFYIVAAVLAAPVVAVIALVRFRPIEQAAARH